MLSLCWLPSVLDWVLVSVVPAVFSVPAITLLLKALLEVVPLISLPPLCAQMGRQEWASANGLEQVTTLHANGYVRVRYGI